MIQAEIKAVITNASSIGSVLTEHISVVITSPSAVVNISVINCSSSSSRSTFVRHAVIGKVAKVTLGEIVHSCELYKRCHDKQVAHYEVDIQSSGIRHLRQVGPRIHTQRGQR